MHRHRPLGIVWPESRLYGNVRISYEIGTINGKEAGLPLQVSECSNDHATEVHYLLLREIIYALVDEPEGVLLLYQSLS